MSRPSIKGEALRLIEGLPDGVTWEDIRYAISIRQVSESGFTLTPAQKAEIASRLKDHRRHPDDVIPWEFIKAEAEARFAH